MAEKKKQGDHQTGTGRLRLADRKELKGKDLTREEAESGQGVSTNM